jgi:hypothetical protein
MKQTFLKRIRQDGKPIKSTKVGYEQKLELPEGNLTIGETK